MPSPVTSSLVSCDLRLLWRPFHWPLYCLPREGSILQSFPKTMNENAERINGMFAMIGIIAAMGSYAVTGQIIPGIW